MSVCQDPRTVQIAPYVDLLHTVPTTNAVAFARSNFPFNAVSLDGNTEAAPDNMEPVQRLLHFAEPGGSWRKGNVVRDRRCWLVGEIVEAVAVFVDVGFRGIDSGSGGCVTASPTPSCRRPVPGVVRGQQPELQERGVPAPGARPHPGERRRRPVRPHPRCAPEPSPLSLPGHRPLSAAITH